MKLSSCFQLAAPWRDDVCAGGNEDTIEADGCCVVPILVISTDGRVAAVNYRDVVYHIFFSGVSLPDDLLLPLRDVHTEDVPVDGQSREHCSVVLRDRHGVLPVVSDQGHLDEDVELLVGVPGEQELLASHAADPLPAELEVVSPAHGLSGVGTRPDQLLLIAVMPHRSRDLPDPQVDPDDDGHWKPASVSR